MSYINNKSGNKLFKELSVIWHILFFRYTYMQLKGVQKFHLGTGIIIQHSVNLGIQFIVTSLGSVFEQRFIRIRVNNMFFQ